MGEHDNIHHPSQDTTSQLAQHTDDTELENFSVITIDKKAVYIPSSLKINLRDGEEIEFYIPPRTLLRSPALWFWILFGMALMVLGLVGLQQTRSMRWMAAVGVGFLPILIGVVSTTSTRVHFIITDIRIIFAWKSLFGMKEESYEFVDELRKVITGNEHRHLISAWYDEGLRGTLESTNPQFRINNVPNMPVVVDHLALQFARIVEQQKWNIPHFEPKTRETGNVQSRAFVYVVMIFVLFVGFLALSVATATLTASLIVAVIFTVFGFVWIGFSAIAVTYGIDKHISDTHKAAGRYFYVANNVNAPPTVHPAVPDGADGQP